MNIAEYIWLDGSKPTQQLRSKSRIVALPVGEDVTPESFPVWSFDGSSTNQASGNDSDCILTPVCAAPDPVRGEGNYLLLCEVMNGDGSPHETNRRARLRMILDGEARDADAWFGFEQEYTLFKDGVPLGFPQGGYPAPQGPFYCGVGADNAHGRELVEAHTRACIDAGLLVYGVNAEVMPGQWEFQIGYRGVDSESADALTVSDHLWIARWLLNRLGEDRGISVSLDPKPVKGDWNGAGAHTNFSTRSMRDSHGGLGEINRAIESLQAAHEEHIAVYGADLELRLTGLHETCNINEFRSGVADRGSCIRIPRQVAERGFGYLEDRRPGANCDPYVVCARLLQTVCAAEKNLAVA